jgi:unsaturated rhamnogalacturonyl hydrolase
MARRSWLLGGMLLLLVSLAPPRAAAALPPLDRQATLAAISRVNDAWIAKHPRPLASNWDWATYFSGDMAAYAATGTPRYLTYARDWAQAHHYDLLQDNTTPLADHQAAGQVYLDLYDLDHQYTDVANLITSLYTFLTTTKRRHDWPYVDALNMAMPVFARVGVLTGDNLYLTAMYAEYQYTAYGVDKRGLYDRKAHLWYRDGLSLPPHLSKQHRPIFWSRGNGWAFAALAKVLAVLPTSAPGWNLYLGTFRQMAAALVPLQRPDGFWNVDLNDPLEEPGPETSGTALFAFGYAWGMRAGVLDPATYMPVLQRAWQGLLQIAVQEDGVLGYVQGRGTGPDTGRKPGKCSTSNFGVGAFLLAANQVAQLASAS